MGPTKKTCLKRKETAKTSLPRKRQKILHRSADDLPWKSVSRPIEAGVGFDDGIFDFEEVEGVEVIYENTDGGRVVKFNVGFISVTFLSIFYSFIYQIIADKKDEAQDKSMENQDIFIEETDQEVTAEPIATFDCTPNLRYSKRSGVNSRPQLKTYSLHGMNILFIQRFYPHYMQSSFPLLHPFKSLLCLFLWLGGTS